MTPERAATRLPAAARRRAILDAALRVFAAGSYSGATTAEIARAVGVTEPILYRHFASKRDLYLACLDEAWRALRAVYDERLAVVGDRDAVAAIGQASLAFHASEAVTPTVLWTQALAEAGDDDVIRAHLRGQLREVHEYVAGAMRRAQTAGGVPPDRDAAAEAWVFVGTGLLAAFADRLGGLLEPDDLAAIAAERQRWLTGSG